MEIIMVMKIKPSLFIIFVSAIFIISITFFSNFQLEKKAYAISNNSAGVDFDTFVPLKSFNNLTIIYPFYIENFKQVIEKNFNEQQQLQEKSDTNRNGNQTTTTGSFSGNGILNDKIDVNVNGTAKVIPIENMSVFISGKAEFTSNIGDRAPYIFLAIGHYNKDGSFNSAGSMFFNSTTTTGELSFLRNTVGIFKDIVDKDGNGTFLMWRWN
jgi:hypothetical protein